MAWKKNFRKVPQKILTKLNNIQSQEVVVGCLKKFSSEEINDGVLSHLNITLTPEGLITPENIIPLASQGKHSAWNVNGREIIRKDLPKETYYNYIESPNWGDSYYGTHTVAMPGERYPREFVAPRNSAIEIEAANSSPGLFHYVIKFQISEILSRQSDQFNDRLFDCLNILQENIGDSGVKSAEATLQDYLQSLQVTWDILPPGTAEEAINRIFTGRQPTQIERETTEDRYQFFMTLNPQSLVYGSSGFQRYFGAFINENLVIFENVQYGNAIYVMFDNWEELSQRSRVELLSGRYGENFERIIHTGNWKNKVKETVRARLKNN